MIYVGPRTDCPGFYVCCHFRALLFYPSIIIIHYIENYMLTQLYIVCDNIGKSIMTREDAVAACRDNLSSGLSSHISAG